MGEDLPAGLHRFPAREFPHSLPRVPIPVRFLLLYLTVSVAWILVTDRLATTFFDEALASSWAQTVKGLLFVVVTAAVMTLAVASYVRRANRDRQALEDAWDETILGWVLAMDARESNLATHSQRVADLTLQLARVMDVPSEQWRDLYRGALLHDIGKLAVPEEVLNFTGRLSEEQWALIRRHPDHAVRMLRPIAFLNASIDIPQSHHERWDGTGYPQGLAGVEIPLWARMFSVVDVYDAITSPRVYHSGESHERAMEIIRSEAGRQFDPDVVAAFDDLMAQGDPTAASR
jgi:putative nucleotidyltransferase with HDIG domain